MSHQYTTVKWTPGEKLADCERDIVMQAIDYCGGNLSRAAVILGISKSGIFRKVREWGLQGARAESKSKKMVGSSVPQERRV